MNKTSTVIHILKSSTIHIAYLTYSIQNLPMIMNIPISKCTNSYYFTLRYYYYCGVKQGPQTLAYRHCVLSFYLLFSA